ncbi:MAG: hypothetical protein HY286_05170 [Planctomycetes bacterium]|nr:hypothetical protein [Planctomycetota bacterium]
MKALHKAGLLVALTIFVRPARAITGPTTIFGLSFNGKNVQAQVVMNPGVKPPTGKVTDKVISEVLRGEKTDWSAQFVDVNAANDGKYYLFYDGMNDWRVGIHKNGLDAVSLHGWVDSSGAYMMFGSYNFAIQGVTPPMFDCFTTGKVTFAKGTFNPTKITGNFYMASPITGDVMTLAIKTTGIVTP